jgi:hypothetical protein
MLKKVLAVSNSLCTFVLLLNINIYKMKRFNEKAATQLIIEVCNNHIKNYGNVLYQPTGFVGKQDDVLEPHQNWNNFTSDLVKVLVDTFGTTNTTLMFIGKKSKSIISKCGIVVGGCYISDDTFTLSYGPVGNTTSSTFVY